MLLSLAISSTQVLLLHLIPLIFANPVQPHLPTLVDTALLNSTHHSLVNTTISDVSRCFERSEGRFQAHYIDCVTAIMKMHGRTETRNYIFGRGSLATFKLPRDYQSGTCYITLDMIHEEQTDILTFAEVREAALGLAHECTLGTGLDRGGVDAVAPRGVLYITILGAEPTATS